MNPIIRTLILIALLPIGAASLAAQTPIPWRNARPLPWPLNLIYGPVTYYSGSTTTIVAYRTVKQNGSVQVQSSASLTIRAGNSVSLQPGFSVAPGGRLSVIVEPIDTDGDGYSDELEIEIGLNPQDPGDVAKALNAWNPGTLPGNWGAKPTWWTTRKVITSDAADDFAAANIGQLKFVAANAARELDWSLLSVGGVSDEIINLVDSWDASPTDEVVRDDYAVINQGQLKSVAELFYRRLRQAGYIGVPLAQGATRPWTTTADDDDDYAVANLGQLKYIFSFDPNPGIMVDIDQDGIDDRWEKLYYKSSAVVSGGEDTDQDGYTTLEEFLLKTSPLRADSDLLPGDMRTYQYDNRGRLLGATANGLNARYTPDAEGNLK
ncbi:MAG: thrombospondin type 3 repeat-containing protein [Verrucomicrobia bacterium]|nr:thrombospondin type 3 repeat-containing protein [Verrucomicrobiota bacterium]